MIVDHQHVCRECKDNYFCTEEDCEITDENALCDDCAADIEDDADIELSDLDNVKEDEDY